MEADHGDDPRYRFIAIPVWDENEVSNFEYEHPDRYTTEKIRDIKPQVVSRVMRKFICRLRSSEVSLQ